MNDLNRNIAPETAEIKKLNFPVCHHQTSSNGIDIYFISAPVEEALKVEFVFDGGICKQPIKGLANAANSLLTEGTSARTAAQIADTLDFYGSYFQPKCTIDDSQLTLYCLKKHLEKCLSVVSEVLLDAYYPENELKIYLKNQKQRLKVQQQKTSYLCRKAFYKTIFGEDSPISSFSESGDYDNISRETVLGFYQKTYPKKIKYITISGAVNEQVLLNINTFLGDFGKQNNQVHYKSSGDVGPSTYIKKEKSVQATIRLGRRLFNRTNEDYRKTQVANMVLGGYFGSRLMKNIREEKGLTYGIHSTLESYLDDGCFYIEADVNTQKHELAVAEIFKEIDRLNNDLVGEKELDTAKNYFLGSLLRGMDGPFSLMDRNRIMIDYGFKPDYYDEFVNIIKEIKPADIQSVFQKYFNQNSLVTVICGG